MRHNRLLFYPYQSYKWVIFFPLLGLSTLIVFILIFIFLFIASQRFMQIAGKIWARFNSLITPMFVTVVDKANIDKNRSYVIVANHQSQYDIFVMYGWLPIDFRWVMKIELRKVPILGYYCYKAGHIYIDRSDSSAAIASINAAKDKIKNGTSILFFPEGTRSITGELMDFKKGAFKFALSINLPILPVTIAGTRNILPANSIALFPGKATMILHEPIDVGGYDDDTVGELAARVKQVIQKSLDGYAK
ncbi:MAG: acyl-phosphate glycerol 3-phosphate acyltransferase [Spirochaetes bacterium RBG_16_49_21]|nr:MAG: acyl-phosphate glycerol 3-phosphate acyltransferase [Spirochaetes bacterium RBG_16_49_21]